MQPNAIDFLIVFALGGLVGFVEMIARYRDAPFKVVISLPGFAYILINALVSLVALWSIRLFDWKPVAQGSAEVNRWVQVASAGLGAMIIFRSSLFLFRVGEEDISVGPNAILQILLDAVDREVDRRRGRQRANAVEKMMCNIKYDEAALNLPPLSIALMQNLPKDEQDRILKIVENLSSAKNKGMPDNVKTLSLGLGIMNVVGEDILQAAINIAAPNNVPGPVAGNIGAGGVFKKGKQIDFSLPASDAEKKMAELIKSTLQNDNKAPSDTAVEPVITVTETPAPPEPINQ
jgi:hypothetical protein